MTESIADFVNRLDLNGQPTRSGGLYGEFHERLIFLEKTHYSQYIPTAGTAYSDYETRLENWLNNLSDEDEKRLLFEFAAHITFLNREDFTKLYQSALEGPIARWILDDAGLSFTDPDLDEKLQSEIHNHTWYCPISDSMPISDFCHGNHLGGIDFRPDFRSLVQFGDRVQKQSEILSFMSSRNTPDGIKPLKRLVLLEDFIGSATQIKCPDVVDFSANISNSISVLIVPLVVCPEGANWLRDKIRAYPNVKFKPILELKAEQFISPNNVPKAGTLFYKIYEILNTSFSKVIGDNAAAPRPYHPSGAFETGARLVMYSNTPANTLPIIQHQSNTWRALFPRSARIK